MGCIFGAYIIHGGNIGVILHALPTELMAPTPLAAMCPMPASPVMIKYLLDLGITAVVVTHNETLARSMPRRLRLVGGQVTEA